MASKNCVTCMRAFQRQSVPQARKATSRFISRAFATTCTRRAAVPEANAMAAASIRHITQARAESSSRSTSTTPSSLEAAKQLKKLTGKATETYTAYGVTESLYKKCAHQADYSIPQAKDEDAEMPKTVDGEDLGVGEGWWHTELGLKPTFSTWSQVTMLHMYILSARFRCLPPGEAQPWQQHLLDHFFHDAERKMISSHNMHARGTRNKYLKDLFVQWRGLLAAYDEGLAKGDAVLAAAVWRNIFKANEDVDVRALAQIVSYMRRLLKSLDDRPDNSVMMGDLTFGSPEAEKKVVDLKSKMMDLPFETASGKDLPGGKQD